MSVFGDMCREKRGERSVSSVSGVANVEIVVRAGASLVTLCPNELYAKQIPPILRSHGETRAGQKHGDIYINTEYSGFGIRNLYFTRETPSSGVSLILTSLGRGWP